MSLKMFSFFDFTWGALAYYLCTRYVPSIASSVPASVDVAGVVSIPDYVVVLAASVIVAKIVRMALTGPTQPKEGGVLLTGCDSGMAEASAYHLAKIGFHVYAGCLQEESKKRLADKAKEEGIPSDRLIYVPLDVTKDESIKNARDIVVKDLEQKGMGLIGIINCAGIAFNGPIQYMPLKYYRLLMDVNYFGYVNVTQHFLPVLRAAVEKKGARRGRVIFVGTGGGTLTPCPALLSAYMGTKWAGEAYIQCLRLEMGLQKMNIDGSMINPGFIKPTGLIANGLAFTEKLWKETPPACKEEWEWVFNKFAKFSADQPGTHVSEIAKTMEEILTVHRPSLSYKVGPDSKATPVVGLLPEPFREWVLRASMYGQTALYPN